MEQIKQRDLQIAKLQEMLSERDARFAQLDAELKESLMENKLLREKVDLLIKKVFGTSSEKLDSAQLSLFGITQENVPGKSDASLESDKEAPPAAASRRDQGKGNPKGVPDNLPIKEEVIDPEEVKTSPEKWRCIGAEVSEQLDYEPAQFFRRRLIRRKYVSTEDKETAPITAELPEKLLERGQIAPGLLAQVVISKYCDHLPLYRQEQIYWQRHRVYLSRQRMAQWVGVAANWMQLIYEEIRRGVMVGGYIQLDETPIRYLDPGNGATKLGYFWTASKPGGDVVYQWETSRAAKCLEKVIPVNFRGTIQCDGYAAYPSFASENPEVELAGCWAHVRRKFFEAREQAPEQMGWVLGQIRELYRIEEVLREKAAFPEERGKVRAAQSQPIVKELFRVLEQWNLVGNILPRSGFGKAIGYILSLKKELMVYLQDGRIEIDNNLVENAIRPTALGKKNWLFIGEAEAGDRSAILYTIVECCRRRGIDPNAYLRDVLTRLPHATNFQIKDLTPEAWAKARSIEQLPKAA